MMLKFNYVLKIIKRLLKTNAQLIHGSWRVMNLPQPIVTVFGSARLNEKDKYMIMAHDLTHLLSEHGISVITGGGPGIMQAATCALDDEHAQKIKGHTLAITVKELVEQELINHCAKNILMVEYFFARKWLMTYFSQAFVIFPGGFGTLDELFEILTLMQTLALPGEPVVLVGQDFWMPLIEWFKNHSISRGLIREKDLELFTVTDDIEYALCLVQEQCAMSSKSFMQKFKS